MTSRATARDIMLADATNACAAASATMPIVYSDAPPAQLDGTKNWARATVRHAGGEQIAFGDDTRKFARYGTLCIEVFTIIGDGLTDQDNLVETITTYIEDRNSYPIAYRNIRAAEAGRDGGYEKTNIYADFEYESNH